MRKNHFGEKKIVKRDIETKIAETIKRFLNPGVMITALVQAAPYVRTGAPFFDKPRLPSRIPLL